MTGSRPSCSTSTVSWMLLYLLLRWSDSLFTCDLWPLHHWNDVIHILKPHTGEFAWEILQCFRLEICHENVQYYLLIYLLYQPLILSVMLSVKLSWLNWLFPDPLVCSALEFRINYSHLSQKISSVTQANKLFSPILKSSSQTSNVWTPPSELASRQIFRFPCLHTVDREKKKGRRTQRKEKRKAAKIKSAVEREECSHRVGGFRFW